MDPNAQPPLQPPASPQLLAGPRPRVPGQPAHPTLTPELEARHQESVRRYPRLSLSVGEYVIEEVRRHPIGLLSIWILTIFLVLVMVALIPFYAINHDFIVQTLLLPPQLLPPASVLMLPVLIIVVLFLLGGVIATYIYEANRFYVTSESVIQFIQSGLFDTKQQTVHLINVEDVSGEQRGPLQQILNYGALRLSTQGEETTYHFHYVANPNRVVNVINDAAERAVKLLQGFPVNEL